MIHLLVFGLFGCWKPCDPGYTLGSDSICKRLVEDSDTAEFDVPESVEITNTLELEDAFRAEHAGTVSGAIGFAERLDLSLIQGVYVEIWPEYAIIDGEPDTNMSQDPRTSAGLTPMGVAELDGADIEDNLLLYTADVVYTFSHTERIYVYAWVIGIDPAWGAQYDNLRADPIGGNPIAGCGVDLDCVDVNLMFYSE